MAALQICYHYDSAVQGIKLLYNCGCDDLLARFNNIPHDCYAE